MTWFAVWVLLSVACGVVLLSLCAVASAAARQMEEELRWMQQEQELGKERKHGS